MTDHFIPDDIQQFILLNIDSVAQLEGLFILRADPQREWSAETVAQRLYIHASDAARLMESLAERGLIAATAGGSYQYHPKSTELEKMISQLADLYSRYLVPITHLIHSKSKNRMQEFANAFKIRKE